MQHATNCHCGKMLTINLSKCHPNVLMDGHSFCEGFQETDLAGHPAGIIAIRCATRNFNRKSLFPSLHWEQNVCNRQVEIYFFVAATFRTAKVFRWSVSQWAKQPNNQSRSQSASQSISQSVSQQASQSVSQSVSPSVSQSVSRSVGQSVSQLVSQ